MKFAFLLAVGFMSLCQSLFAAEIKLRSECQAAGPLVTLGQLAEIIGDESEVNELRTTEILPSPSPGKKRTLSSRQVQDLLVLRGVAAGEHQISGARQVTILGSAIATSPHTPGTSARQTTDAKKSIERGIKAYLTKKLSGEAELNFQLTPQQCGVIGGEVQILGGTSPWLGPQTFIVKSAGHSFTLEVQVTQSPKVVVATTTIPRGAIVQASDVQLRASKAAEGNVKVYGALEDVVGKEAVRNIAGGQLIDDQTVKAPLLVRRGEVVDVLARTAGVQVRVKARSRGDGSRGDLVTVESIADRKAFVARVIGPQEVEIFAKAAAAETAAYRSAR